MQPQYEETTKLYKLSFLHTLVPSVQQKCIIISFPFHNSVWECGTALIVQILNSSVKLYYSTINFRCYLCCTLVSTKIRQPEIF